MKENKHLIVSVALYLVIFSLYLYFQYHNAFEETQGGMLSVLQFGRIIIWTEIVLTFIYRFKNSSVKKRVLLFFQDAVLIILLTGTVLWITGINDKIVIVENPQLLIEQEDYLVRLGEEKIHCTSSQYNLLKESKEPVVLQYRVDSLTGYQKVIEVHLE